jgi:hypothetical protein
MPKPLWCIVIVFLLLAGCQGHELDARNYAEDAVQWGQAVNGLQVGLARRTYRPGTAPGMDQIYFSVQLRNVSGRSLSVLAPATIKGTVPEKRAGDESVAVNLLYATPAGEKTATFRPEKKPVVQVMEPGKEYSLELRLSPSKFGMDRFVPGRVMAVYTNAQATIQYASMGGEPTTGLWTGEARSGTVAIDVAAPTTATTTAPVTGGRQGGGDGK